jgi:hypothetical protein
MKNGVIGHVVLGVILLAGAASLGAADNYKVVNGPKDFYFGHISYIEPTPEGTDPAVLREGRSESEQAVLNLPIGPGDTVRTSADRRCEIQFDTGTVVRLDFATEVRVETILARSLSSLEELSVLTLGRGRIYVLYKEYNNKEMFQVLTSNAAVKMKHNSVALVSAAEDGTTETQVRYGRANMLFGPSEGLLDDRTVRKGERLIVLKDHQFELATAIDGSDFELWNKDINAHFDDLHKGLTALPKPIQKLPPAVFYFAQTYGSNYGEWLWDDLYGYVWRPFIDNGAYPWGWSPYYYGRWSYAAGQMFWVPEEPWGWIPYHLGVWQWDKKHGWVWLPGSMFASAWATWDFYFGYACWRPWSLYDWMGGYRTPGWGFYNYGSRDGGWYYNWPYGDDGSGLIAGPARTVVRKDALKQPATSLPLPVELKGVLKRVTDAYGSGDARIRASAAEVPRHLVFVAKEDLKARAVNEKALTWDQVAKHGAPSGGEAQALRRISDPPREAARIFRGIDGPATAPRKVSTLAPKTDGGGNAAAIPVMPSGRADVPIRRSEAAAVRFRDWNPDLRVARDLGVHIQYSSAKNEIRCPELGISSKDRELPARLAPHMTSQGVRYGPARSVDSSGGSSSALSGSGAPQTGDGQAGSSSRGSSSSGSRESGGGTEGGKIKK